MAAIGPVHRAHTLAVETALVSLSQADHRSGKENLEKRENLENCGHQGATVRRAFLVVEAEHRNYEAENCDCYVQKQIISKIVSEFDEPVTDKIDENRRDECDSSDSIPVIRVIRLTVKCDSGAFE